VLIAVENLRAKLLEASEADEKWLDKILSFKTKSYLANRYGDGRVRLLDSRSKSFPAGLVGAVRKRAKKDGKRVELVDRRVAPTPSDPTALVDWLRDHQLGALAAAKKFNRGVFHHVTGSGKTEIMVGLTELYPTRWLILVHAKDLLHQTAERFRKRTGERVGIVGDGQMQLGKRITVAMFQSVHSGLTGQHKAAMRAFLDAQKGVLVDECHVVPAATYWQVMMALPNAYFRYGFSGTPFARGDQKSLYVVATLGPAIHRVSAEELVSKGLLAKPKIRLVPVKHDVDPSSKTWDQVYKSHIVRSRRRNKAIISAAQIAKKPCLLFVKALEHGRYLEKEIRAQGIDVEFIWGKHVTPERRAALRRLVHGDIDVLICNVIFQQGIDIPELQSVIIGSGGKSEIMVLQDTGRGMRRHDASGAVMKDEFEVFDIQDRGCGCAGRHNSCRWLEKHTKDRLRAYATEQYPVFVTNLGLGGARKRKVPS